MLGHYKTPPVVCSSILRAVCAVGAKQHDHSGWWKQVQLEINLWKVLTKPAFSCSQSHWGFVILCAHVDSWRVPKAKFCFASQYGSCIMYIYVGRYLCTNMFEYRLLVSLFGTYQEHPLTRPPTFFHCSCQNQSGVRYALQHSAHSAWSAWCFAWKRVGKLSRGMFFLGQCCFIFCHDQCRHRTSRHSRQ